MPKSKTAIQTSFSYLIAAFSIIAIEWFITEWAKINMKKVIPGMIFLTGLYLLFYYAFVFVQKKHSTNSGFILLGMMLLKMCFIIVFLFLFLNPMDNGNKREILLFLMNYFALLTVDITIKLRLMK